MSVSFRSFSSFKRFPLVVILGSTGTGKSKLAIEIASKFDGEIISADSMQIYKGLDIVTNKVTEEECASCPHHMIGYVDPLTTNYTVVDFRDRALLIIDKLHKDGKLPIIVGGTNYYIESLLWQFLVNKKELLEAKTEACLRSAAETAPRLSHLLLRPDVSEPVPLTDVRLNGAERDVFAGVENQEQQQQASPVSSVSTRGGGGGGGGVGLSDTAPCPPPPRSPHLAESQRFDSIAQSGQTATCDDQRQQQQQHEEPPTKLRGDQKLHKLVTMETSELYERLKEVDEETARRVHPRNRRKIIRALEVYETHSVKLSAVMQAQHPSSSDHSGPLRFPDPCLLWVKADQSVLDERTDHRVDQMIKNGLIEEMKLFHKSYNQHLLETKSHCDYTLGIFQSIGFKEFHNYLILSEKERNEEEGRKLFTEGVEKMKQVTRKYARKQTKWIVNRFLKRRSKNFPFIYSFDSSSKEGWSSNVAEPASSVVSSYLQCLTPDQSPEPFLKSDVNLPAYNTCSICDMIFVDTKTWKAHIHGKRHKRNVCRSRRNESSNNP